VTIDSRHRLRHSIAFADESSPTSTAKPRGVIGTEIWIAITPSGTAAPSDQAAFQFVALDTRSPHAIDFTGADAGRAAHYLLCWTNTRGQKGPWSETATATIGA
jgi:hypothetical protein